MRRFAGVVVAVGLAAPAFAQPAPEAARPSLVLKADRGFIDDPFALDPETDRLALLRTDSASFARIEIVDLGSGKTVKIMPAGDPQQLFDRILFAPGGGIVLVTRNGANGARSAQHYTAEGKPLGFAGPVTDFGLMVRAGQSYLVGWDRKPGASGETTFVLTQYQLDGLARVGKSRSVAITRDGALKAPPLKVLAWQDGYAQILGQRAGGYDKKKDMRQPDRAAVFDLFQSAFVSESEIGDVMGWVAYGQLRRNRPNRTLMAVVTEDHDAVHLVDTAGRRVPVTLAAPMSVYDPLSLQEQDDGVAGVLHFSLSVDPLHEEALARRKADRAYLDLYRARLRSGARGSAPAAEVQRVLRAPLDDRPVAWAVGGKFAAILRKHKSFSRGAGELEVYPLAAK